jgi:hypothetical protein
LLQTAPLCLAFAETDEQLEEVGLDTLTYDNHWRNYRLRIESDIDEKQRESFVKLIRGAREGFGKST